MAIDAASKLQQLIEEVQDSKSKLNVAGSKKIEDNTKKQLAGFQSGLAGIKNPDPMQEAANKIGFSAGAFGMNFLLKKMFGGEDALKDRKEFKEQRKRYQELKTEYLSSKFKDPETAELLRQLAPKFEKESSIRTAQSDYDKIISVGKFLVADLEGKPIPLEEQIKELRNRVDTERLSPSERSLYQNEIERRSMLFNENAEKRKEEQAIVNETQRQEALLTSNYGDFEQSLADDPQLPAVDEPFDLETGYTKGQAGVGERTRGYRKGLLEELSKKKGDFGD